MGRYDSRNALTHMYDTCLLLQSVAYIRIRSSKKRNSEYNGGN